MALEMTLSKTRAGDPMITYLYPNKVTVSHSTQSSRYFNGFLFEIDMTYNNHHLIEAIPVGLGDFSVTFGDCSLICFLRVLDLS